MFRSVNEGGTDKVVTFKNYGPTRVVLSGEPARSAQELIYAGSFADPPSGHYVLNAVAWDRGSEVWLQNQTNNDDDWASYSGPLGYHHGNLFQNDSDAAVHIPDATYVGRVYITGHGGGQKPRIVTAFSAPTADNWQWVALGVSIQDVSKQVAAHNVATDAHADIRALIAALSAAGGITPAAAAALVTAHNAATDAHADIRALIASISAASGLAIAAYAAAATYSRGSGNSVVTHASGLYIYISGTERSSNHDPGLFPGYWYQLSEGVAYTVVGDANYRFAARTICVFDDTDEVFLCTTTQTTPRGKAYIRSQAGSLGGAFIQLRYTTLPRAQLPPVREWILNAEYKKGEIVDTTGAGHVHFIALVDNNSSSIANRKQPGTDDGMGVWDQLYTVDNPPPPAGGGGGGGALVEIGSWTFSSVPFTLTFCRRRWWIRFTIFLKTRPTGSFSYPL